MQKRGSETEIGIGPMNNPENSKSTVTDRRAERAGTDADADGRRDGGGRFYSNVSYTGINASRSSPVQMAISKMLRSSREGGRAVARSEGRPELDQVKGPRSPRLMVQEVFLARASSHSFLYLTQVGGYHGLWAFTLVCQLSWKGPIRGPFINNVRKSFGILDNPLPISAFHTIYQ